jgi:hypothetical protein
MLEELYTRYAQYLLKLKTEKCMLQYHRNKGYKNLEDLGEHVIINMTHYTSLGI